MPDRFPAFSKQHNRRMKCYGVQARHCIPFSHVWQMFYSQSWMALCWGMLQWCLDSRSGVEHSRAFSHRKESLKKGGSAFQPAKWPGIGWRKLVWAEGCSLYCVSPQAGQKIVLTRQPPVDVRRSAARGKRVKQSCFLSINRRLLRWPSQTAPLTTCQISIVQVSFRYSLHVNSIKRGLTWKRHTCWYLKQTRKHPLVSNFTPLKEGSFPRHCASHHGPFVSLLSIHLKVTHRGDTFDICPM